MGVAPYSRLTLFVFLMSGCAALFGEPRDHAPQANEQPPLVRPIAPPVAGREPLMWNERAATWRLSTLCNTACPWGRPSVQKPMKQTSCWIKGANDIFG